MLSFGQVRFFLVALEDDEFGMALIAERLLERMDLQCTESARERLLLISGNFLIPKKQNLVFKEGGVNFVERVVADQPKIDALAVGAQGPCDRIHRNMLPRFIKVLSSQCIFRSYQS